MKNLNKFKTKCSICKKRLTHDLFVVNTITRGEMTLCLDCFFYESVNYDVISYDNYVIDNDNNKVILVYSEFYESRLDEKYI